MSTAKCRTCEKEFEFPAFCNPKEYAWQYGYKGSPMYFCSYTCMREYEKKRFATKQSNARRIECVELNMTFDSVGDAADYIAYIRNPVSSSHISNAAKGINETAAGFHWRYVD